jgi:hypothetical protein
LKAEHDHLSSPDCDVAILNASHSLSLF